jgi:hypothetical protein
MTIDMAATILRVWLGKGSAGVAGGSCQEMEPAVDFVLRSPLVAVVFSGEWERSTNYALSLGSHQPTGG